MKPAAYRAIRQRIGTQAVVAEKLGVTRETITRREGGKIPISKEAELAILALK